MDSAQTKSRQGGASLKFVNVSHPDDTRKRKGLQTEIRRHVMKDIGKQRRKKPSPESSGSPCDVTLQALVESPGRSLPSLGGFPVAADMRTIQLVRLVKEFSGQYIAFRDLWFEVSLSDLGAFQVTLGNSVVFENSLTNREIAYSAEAQKHYSQSLNKLRQRIGKAEELKSQGIIANILGHVCLNMRTHDWDSWAVHMAGLDLVWRARGRTFADTQPYITTLVLVYDLGGAMMADSPPRFPLPHALDKLVRPLEPAPRCLLEVFSALPGPTEATADIETALTLLSSVAETVNINSHSSAFWRRDVDGYHLIGPCIHFLLSMPRMPATLEPGDDDLIVREIVRLTGLLLMSELKERFSFFCDEKPALQNKLERFLLHNATSVDERYNTLILWAVTTASLLNSRSGEPRLGGLMEQWCRRTSLSVQDAIDKTRRMVWMSILTSPFEEILLAQIESTMTGFVKE